jgi:orotidine-5'-phosphate decarboxylase
VAFDFGLDLEHGVGPREAVRQALLLARQLEGLGVVAKFNSLLRFQGYQLISLIRSLGLEFFADLKLNDISQTLKLDGEFLFIFKPEIVTVMATAGVSGMKILKSVLPETDAIAVTALSSFDDADSYAVHNRCVGEAVKELAYLAMVAGLDGLVCAGKDIPTLASIHPHLPPHMSVNVPGIRPEWSIIEGDDQNPARVMTPAQAIKAGATRIIVGRPITLAKDPREAVLRTIDEIAEAMAVTV